MKCKLIQIVIFSFLFLFVLSCSPTKDNAEKTVPSDIIQPDSMVNILTEVHIAEAMLREIKTDSKQKGNTAEAYYSEIFKKHGITREQYNKSVEYYQQHLDIYQDIYEEVITLLSKMQSENTSEN